MALPDLMRRVQSMARAGKVEEIDAENGLVRVRIGNLLTGWLQVMAQRAGSARSWGFPGVSESVVVLSLMGDSRQGIVIGSLHTDSNAAPSADPDIFATEYSDGTLLEYNVAQHKLTAKLCAGGEVLIECDGGMTIKGDLRVEGNIKSTSMIEDAVRSMQADRNVFNVHTHAGVTPGGSVTAPPTPTE